MKALYAHLLIVGSLGLGACAPQVPVPDTYAPTFQKKMQAAQHWDVLAAGVAERLRESLGTHYDTGQPIVLHVQEPQPSTTFTQAFHGLLITQLMQEGFGVSRDPAVGMPVTYEVQVISHKNRDLGPTSTPPQGQAQGDGFNNRNSAGVEGSLGNGQGQYANRDTVYFATGPVPDNEIIVTTYIAGGGRYVTRMSDILYINDNNRGQYLSNAPVTRRMEVVGP